MTFIRYSTSQFWRHGVQRMNRNPNHNRAFHSQLCRSTSCSVSNLGSNNKSNNNNNNNNIPNLYSKNHERYFSSAAPSNNDNNDEDSEEEEEDPDLKKRNKSIIVNENGQSVYMLPNQRVYKVNPQTGVKRNVHQVSLGSFWMVKDLRDTGNKPILSNPSLISVMDAQLFPLLTDVTTLSGKTVTLPDFLIKHDGTSENSCTLVAISYKDFGYKMLSKWVEPFEQAFLSNQHQHQHQNNNVSTMYLNITEGSLLSYFSGILTKSIQKNTPPERHETTLLHFGDVESFRDVLRMHNTLTGYVVLVDGLGRVRWMGSGEPDDDGEELNVLLECAKELVRGPGGESNSVTSGFSHKQKHSHRNRKTSSSVGRVGKKTGN